MESHDLIRFTEIVLKSPPTPGLKLFIKPVVGIVKIFTLVKLNEGFMIEKLSISRPSLKMTTRQPLLAMPTPLDTTSSGIILIS